MGLPDGRRRSSRLEVGRLGEELACSLLARRGVRILARNLRVAEGEIDILGQVDGERAVIEVRTVRSEEPAASAFGREKSDQVWRLARSLRPPAGRVDLVAVRLHREGVELHWVQRIG